MNETTPRTQLRATCPACFATQAIRRGRMVNHGYRRPQHWGGIVGNCDGAKRDAMHFGTEQGRDFTTKYAEEIRQRAELADAEAVKVLEGTGSVYGRKRVGGYASMTYMAVLVENPTAKEKEDYAAGLRYSASCFRKEAADLDKRVAEWQPAEPTEVKVESKVAPVHFRATWYNKHGHKACAASAMGAMKGWPTLTDKASEVTCERCKTRKSFQDAAAAEAAAAQ